MITAKNSKKSSRKLVMAKQFMTVLVSFVLSVGILSGGITKVGTQNGVEAAKTVAELRDQKAKNKKEIAELESQINSLGKKQQNEAAYQATLSAQLELIRSNLIILEEELQGLSNDIATLEDDIETLNGDIAVQEVKVADNTELFKKRLKAMYMSGNDSLMEAVVGATDFYEMLSRMEMVNRIAKHDNDLISELKSDIELLNTQKSALETDCLELGMQKDEQEIRKAEFEDMKLEANRKYEESQEYMQTLKRQQDVAKLSADELKKMNAEFEAEEAKILAMEEAARKKAEAEKKAAEEAAKKASQSNNTGDKKGSGSSGGGTTVEPKSGNFTWPVPGYYYISSGYGQRWGKLHSGIDIAGSGIHGKSVVAAKSGTVSGVTVSTGTTGYGTYVLITHADGYSTLYAHLSSADVSVGDKVSAGDRVGAVGNTGHSYGSHLHFEIRVNGVAKNPQNYF